jgi:hypothetical protein
LLRIRFNVNEVPRNPYRARRLCDGKRDRRHRAGAAVRCGITDIAGQPNRHGLALNIFGRRFRVLGAGYVGIPASTLPKSNIPLPSDIPAPGRSRRAPSTVTLDGDPG